jgi:beta-phosphoglucomutase-like phosphatase (HAD superfamily)
VADRFDLVIFDNDGVLVDSEWHANGILAGLLTELGLPCTREECIRDYMDSTMARVREIAEARIGCPLPPDLEDRYHEQLFEAFRTKLTAVPGVADVLAQLTTPSCVASSGSASRWRRPACSGASTDASSARRTSRAASPNPTCSFTPRVRCGCGRTAAR